MSEEQKSTVPAFIPTTWNEGGEPDVFTPIEECTTGQINMSEEQKSTVPAFIPTTWNEGGEPDVFTPIEECTTGQINTYILKILDQVWALQNEIALLTSYKTLAAVLAAAISDDTP